MRVCTPRAAVVALSAAMAFSVSMSREAVAQAYPSQDVRFVVGFAAGSGPDTIARFVAEKMRPQLKTIIVENKVGAVGNIASEYVARAKPDGHTLYVTGGNALAASGHLFKNPPVDVSKAFDLVATLSRQPVMLVVAPNSPAKTLAELTAIVKQKGDKAAYGTAFPSARVAGALYRKIADTKAVEVQYRTSRDWVNDLTNGAIDYAFIDATSGVGLAAENRLKVIALTMGERSKALPQYPTMKEGGVALDMPGWWAVFAPAGTPKPVIEQLNKAFSEVVSREEGRAFFTKLGNDPWVTTPAEGQAFYLKEYKDWGDYVRVANIEPQG
jgi:tripartite-type tricarboxylate transporter receptor subunit TctC